MPHHFFANARLEAGEAELAIPLYKRALEIDPKCAETHVNLGVAQFTAGDESAAAASYRGAIELQPVHAMAHSNLGVVLNNTGDIDSAMTSWKRAIKVNPRCRGWIKNASMDRKRVETVEAYIRHYKSGGALLDLTFLAFKAETISRQF